VLGFGECCGGDSGYVDSGSDLVCSWVLTEEDDSLRWTLSSSGVFSVTSMYIALKVSRVKWPHRKFWFVRVPLKVKKKLWLTAHNSILTKDNSLHRGWKGKEAKCSFCDCDETVDHLCFTCSLAR
jgi:hypothetical protein